MHIRVCGTSEQTLNFELEQLELVFITLKYISQCRGHGSCFPSHANEAMGLSRGGVWTHIPVPAHMVPPLDAYKSQLRGTHTYIYIDVNRCCFIWSLAPVMILLNKYIYIYIDMYVSSKLVSCFRDSVPIGSLCGSVSNLV